MATKTEIQALINTDLASASNITATELRTVLTNGFVNELYASKIVDTQLTTNVLTASLPATDFIYNLAITKRGNDVNINGYIQNLTGTLIGFTNIFVISNEDFAPDGSQYAIASNNALLNIYVNEDTDINYIFLNNPIGASRIYVNFNYKTID